MTNNNHHKLFIVETIDFDSPAEVYWARALERIASRRRRYTKELAKNPDSEKVWTKLEHLVELEKLARFSLKPPV